MSNRTCKERVREPVFAYVLVVVSPGFVPAEIEVEIVKKEWAQ